MDADEQQRAKDAAYRAIGRYVVQFSSLLAWMKRGIVGYFGDGTLQRATELELLLGEAQPRGLANVFFSVCGLLEPELDADEQKVLATLHKEVREVIEQRNDLAHGDWFVGRLIPTPVEGSQDEQRLEVGPPRLRRVLPGRRAMPIRWEELPVEELDERADRVAQLVDIVAEFGELATGAPLAQGYRVRDIYTVEGGKKNQPTRVVRNGPKASKRFHVQWSQSA